MTGIGFCARHRARGRWRYASGRPCSPFDPVLSAQAGAGIVRRERINTERHSAYHRLDLRSAILIAVMVWVLAGVRFEGLRDLWDVRARLDGAERDALSHDKALAEAELRVLQAQVEPHFLFNTLANVISLIHTHPDPAARLLERLASLLRASVRAERSDGEVRLRVTDDGAGLDPDAASHGVGLVNVRERLQATFGERGRLALSETPGGGVSADLRIPAIPAAEAEAR